MGWGPGKEGEFVDLYMVQVDDLDVAILDSEEAAIGHARRIDSDNPGHQVRVIPIQDGSLELCHRIPAAEAVTG